MAKSEELNAKLIREMNERAAQEQAQRREAQQRQQELQQQLDDPNQEQTRQQLEQDQQAERQRAQQNADQQRAQQQRDDVQNVQAAVVDDDLSHDDPSYGDPTLGSQVEDDLDLGYDDYDDDYGYDELGGGGAPVVGGGEQTWAAPAAENRREGRPAPGAPAGRQHDPDAAPGRRPGERPGRAPGAGPDVRPGQDTPGQDTPGQGGPTRPPGTQSGDRAAQQHTGRDTGDSRPGQGPQRPGGPNSGPGRGAGPGAGRGPGAGAGAGAQNRPGPAGPPAQRQQRSGQGRQRLGGTLKAVGGAMDPSGIVEGGAVGRGRQSMGVTDAAFDVMSVLQATKAARTIQRPQVGTQAAPHAGSTAGGHHRAQGHGGRSQAQSQDLQRTRQ